MFEIFKTVEKEVAPAVVERPPLPALKLEKIAVAPQHDELMAEYATLAEAIGIAPPDMKIEQFKGVLAKLDIPIFALPGVIAYMDEKARKESKHQAGWEWRPLREKDNRFQMAFGTAAGADHDGRNIIRTAASDYYPGGAHVRARTTTGIVTNGTSGYGLLQQMQAMQGSGYAEEHTREFDRPSTSLVYDRTIPLHAVRRIAAIEAAFTGDVGFFVSDYALAPQVRYPDPFLMAVIPNIDVRIGTGRFVIDFWDEPGFGIEAMLAK